MAGIRCAQAAGDRPDRLRLALMGAMLLSPLAAATGQAAARKVYRVSGAVTPKTYRGLESFLFNSLDQVVGLKLRFEANKDAEPGMVAAYDEDGLFIAYLRETPSESQISAKAGYNFQNGGYVVDGFFVVKNAGMNQGITALFLEKSDEGAVLTSGAKVSELDIDRLKADIRK